jgi:DNA polymerase-3 subunit gamma/tau
LNEQASAFGTSRLVAALEALAQAEKEMRWSDSGRVVLEVALARLMLRPASGQAARSEASLATQAVGRTSTAQRRTDERPLQPIPAPQSPAGPDAASQSSSGGRSQPGTAAITGSGEAGGPRANGADEAEAAFDPFEHEELPSTTRRPPPQAAPSRASTPASPSSASASSRAAGLDQAQLEARWNVVIEELRRARAVTTATLLAEGRLLRADSEGLVIGFRSATLRDAWERGNHKKQLSTALHAVFGSSLPVRTDLVKEGSPAPPDPEASRSGTSRRPPAAPAISPAAAPRAGGEAAPTPGMLEGEALLHETIALFDGRIVETETE